MGKYEKYAKLLTLTYDEAVERLLQKYGPAQDDYFREKSYYRYLNGEIKSITKGKFTRTDDGLYCHHIDENIAHNLTDIYFIKAQNIPYEYHKKDRLVFCDLIEHAILHVLIAKETSKEFGYPGYEIYIKPDIEFWYLLENIPDTKWRKNCYKKAYLEPHDAFDILAAMQKTLGESYYYSLEFYYEELERERIEREEKLKEWEKRKEIMRIESRNRWIGLALELHENSPRKDIVEATYHLKYDDSEKPLIVYDGFKDFDLKMKQYRKDEILQELQEYLMDIGEMDGEINN